MYFRGRSWIMIGWYAVRVYFWLVDDIEVTGSSCRLCRMSSLHCHLIMCLKHSLNQVDIEQVDSTTRIAGELWRQQGTTLWWKERWNFTTQTQTIYGQWNYFCTWYWNCTKFCVSKEFLSNDLITTNDLLFHMYYMYEQRSLFWLTDAKIAIHPQD